MKKIATYFTAFCVFLVIVLVVRWVLGLWHCDNFTKGLISGIVALLGAQTITATVKEI